MHVLLRVKSDRILRGYEGYGEMFWSTAWQHSNGLPLDTFAFFVVRLRLSSHVAVPEKATECLPSPYQPESCPMNLIYSGILNYGVNGKASS
jgi:hypothetical protein